MGGVRNRSIYPGTASKCWQIGRTGHSKIMTEVATGCTGVLVVPGDDASSTGTTGDVMPLAGIVVASGDDGITDRHGTKRTRAVGSDDMRHGSKVLSYQKLTVGDAQEHDMMVIKINNDIVFEKACLCLPRSNHEYEIEYAVIERVTYLKSLEKYESYEFEQIFGFGSDCHDFVKGKIVVVRSTSF